MFGKDKDPIREALQEILEMAQKYKDEPLMNKMKGKMKVAVVESPDEESEEMPEKETIGEVKKDEPDMDDDMKEKLRKLLGC